MGTKRTWERTGSEHLEAGKRRSLHSPQDGMKVTKDKKRELGEDTHNYDNVFGWNRKG